MYLCGTLGAADAFPLRRVCRDIPHRVTTLRLDMHAVTRLEEGATESIRSLVRFWRDTRGGGFRLSLASEHLVATYVDAGERSSDLVIARIDARKAALTGMFL